MINWNLEIFCSKLCLGFFNKTHKSQKTKVRYPGNKITYKEKDINFPTKNKKIGRISPKNPPLSPDKRSKRQPATKEEQAFGPSRKKAREFSKNPPRVFPLSPSIEKKSKKGQRRWRAKTRVKKWEGFDGRRRLSGDKTSECLRERSLSFEFAC